MNLEDLVGSPTKQTKVASASMTDNINWGHGGVLDHVLQGRKATVSNSGLALPVNSGTRVSFRVSMASVLAYNNLPPQNVLGTVVTVRSAGGDSTLSRQGYVHVLWDDGQYRAIQAKHLRRDSSKRASTVRMRVGSLGDLSSFFDVQIRNASEVDLVHKATKDLWSFRQSDEGFVIERLFTEDGVPLKV